MYDCAKLLQREFLSSLYKTSSYISELNFFVSVFFFLLSQLSTLLDEF